MIQIDMDMPKSCAVCPFNSRCDDCECIPNFCMAMLMEDQEGDCHPMIGYFNDGTHEYDPEIGFTPEDRRQEWCPLKEVKRGEGEMTDLISRQAVIDALVERMGIDWDSLKTLQPALKVIENVPSAEPVKNELVTDFVDTAEKAAKVEVMSKKDAQATSDAWKMFNRILETEHD